jgi:putative addiction module CopG family antidote
MVHSGHLEPEYVAMEITLPSDLQKFVEEKVREGQFASADQVIVGALAVLREQEELRDEDVAELRGEVATALEQLDRGESAAWDVEETKRRLLDRVAKSKRAS